MSGHGWINPRPDGAHARCGGPGLCAECSRETCNACHKIGAACRCHVPATSIKRMTPAEFRDQGYLMEVNRQFLHPLGLALEIVIDGAGVRFGEVRDHRDDPEGMMFSEIDDHERERAASIEAERQSKREAREALGIWPVQPL